MSKLIVAAAADREQAIKFLQSIGFKDLSFKSDEDDMIKFWYKSFDFKTVEHYLGEPKSMGKSIRYDYGTLGVIAIWPVNKVVVLKNASRVVLKIEPTETHVPHEHEIPKKGLPPVSGIKEQDDSKVPNTQIPENLKEQYKVLGGNSSLMAKQLFNKQLWKYLNNVKFQDRMILPTLGFLKATDPKNMRLRGRWWAVKRLLEVSPNLYNAHQDFFVEIFLHEMCHQAVSEIDKTRENEQKGHGPLWQKWMKHVGLNPRRFDPNDNTVYMNKEQLDQHLKEKEQRKLNFQSLEQQIQQMGLRRNMGPRSNTPCQIGIDGRMVKGMIVCPANQNGSKLAILTVDNVAQYLASGKLQWRIKDADNIYTYGEGSTDAYSKPMWVNLSEAIRKSYALGNVKTSRNK